METGFSLLLFAINPCGFISNVVTVDLIEKYFGKGGR
jgi:hypothetical protein